jgi:hypothetical protein
MCITCSAKGRRLSQLRNINHLGNEAKKDPSLDFSIINGTETGHEA